MTKTRSRRSPQERLQRRLAPTGTGCLEWTGARNEKGYGRIGCEMPGQPRTMYAHRLAFYLANGYLPKLIRHTCDNPPCCNPQHLLPGTQLDNMRDAVERDRIARPPRSLNVVGHEYNYCNCETCLDTRTEIKRASYKERVRRGPPPHTDGSASYYTNYGCRCEPCKVAQRAVNSPNVRARRARIRMTTQ